MICKQIVTGVVLLLGFTAGLQGQEPGFGEEEHRAFGDALWEKLDEQNLVGEGAIMSMPYEGSQPHGSVLVTLESEVTVDGVDGAVIVKRNYAGEGASVDSVMNNPADYLGAITVMFQREGFDADNNDWFWAKYFPDGSYDQAPNGKDLVGAAPGCISCHSEEVTGDMVFLNDRY